LSIFYGRRLYVYREIEGEMSILLSLSVQSKVTKKNANTLRSYSALSKSYDEELGLVVTRASDRLRHLTLFSVAAPNASSAIVCSWRLIVASPHLYLLVPRQCRLTPSKARRICFEKM